MKIQMYHKSFRVFSRDCDRMYVIMEEKTQKDSHLIHPPVFFLFRNLRLEFRIKCRFVNVC